MVKTCFFSDFFVSQSPLFSIFFLIFLRYLSTSEYEISFSVNMAPERFQNSRACWLHRWLNHGLHRWQVVRPVVSAQAAPRADWSDLLFPYAPFGKSWSKGGVSVQKPICRLCLICVFQCRFLIKSDRTAFVFHSEVLIVFHALPFSPNRKNAVSLKGHARAQLHDAGNGLLISALHFALSFSTSCTTMTVWKNWNPDDFH